MLLVLRDRQPEAQAVLHVAERNLTMPIALISDDPAARDRLVMIFASEGFLVWAYPGAEEFLHSTEAVAADCVLLDLGLRSGFEVLKTLIRESYRAPVIVIADRSDIPTAVAAIKAGAHDFFEKPFDVPEMIECVRAAVNDLQATRQSGRRPVRDRCFPGADALTRRELDVLEQIVGEPQTR